MTDRLVVLLHLCDSLFPIGSFAHSDGLEAATARNEIRTATELRAWMEVTLAELLGRVEGPAVARAWNFVTHGQFDDAVAMDDEVDALRPTSTGRESTRAMGSRLLKTWRHIRPEDSVRLAFPEPTQLTLPVAFGAVAAASGIPALAALEGFMYTRLAAIVSAAMRLMPLGQHQGHALLAEALSRVPTLAAAVLKDDGPLGAFTPVLDVMVMSQQYVESRLFKS
jgi:urease accessory protein